MKFDVYYVQVKYSYKTSRNPTTVKSKKNLN